MKSTLTLVLFQSVLLVCCLAPLGFAQTNVVPRDFYLVAKYGAAGAGFSQKSWTLTISVDGNALQESCCNWDEKPITPMKSSSLLSENDLKEIVSSIKESEFFTLPKEPYPDKRTDAPIVILSVIMDGKSHEVRMHPSVFAGDKSFIERFLRVWSTVLRKVPSPNENRELKFIEK